jgi:hypothetical protein
MAKTKSKCRSFDCVQDDNFQAYLGGLRQWQRRKANAGPSTALRFAQDDKFLLTEE